MTSAPSPAYHTEEFTAEETAVLSRFFTNIDLPVFALVNLPEVVKGALFSRYSRTPKSVRRLFLDEFVDNPDTGIAAIADQLTGPDPLVNLARAEDLYRRLFTEYGDDSVAQLGGVHLACEQASNVLTKVLEWGRLAAYLEQSTRYMYYDRPLGGGYRYHTPAEVAASPLAARFAETLDASFAAYSSLTDRLTAYYETLYPPEDGDTSFAYRSSIRARVCDDLRGLLPAATVSNVGIYASGQAYEHMLLRMRAHPLAEVRSYADLMLGELRKVIPSFLRRVDLPDRGVAWSTYLAETAARIAEQGRAVPDDDQERPEVTLVEWDPDGETKVAAAALYSVTNQPDDVLAAYVRGLPPQERAALIRAYVGTAATGGTSRAERWSAPGTDSTCCATTGSSETCSATACSRSSGRPSARSTGTSCPIPYETSGARRYGRRSWTVGPPCTRRSKTNSARPWPSTRFPSPTGSVSTCR